MSELLIILLLSSMFLAVKAVEYRGVPGLGPVTSIGAWVAYGAFVLVLLLT